MATEYGLLLPHFGEHASVDKLIKGSKRAERLGFDSVFVRDHLLFHPHGMEGSDNTFIDPFVVLSAVGAVTTRLKLGTGSLIPHRHPLLLALMINSLQYMFGNRLILSVGLGNFQHEFDALGIGEWKRDELVEEQVVILRQAWTQEHFTHQGRHYRFGEVGFKPRPASPPKIWYAGGTPASVRRALAFCDGWLPGRITLATYRKRVAKLRSEAAAQGKPRPLEGCIPITSISTDRGKALAKVNIPGMLASAEKQKFWVKPASGSFSKAEDLEGSLMFGDPEDIAGEVEKYLEVGIDHLIFDLRFAFDEWEQGIELLGREVLPRVRELEQPRAKVANL